MPTLKRILLALFFCLVAGSLFAQHTMPTIAVKGTVIDSVTGKPMEFVTASLQNSSTHQSVKTALSGTDGNFELKTPANGPLSLAIIFVGYKTKFIPVSGNGSVLDLGKIGLSPASKQLQEVSVSAAKPLMKREIDRISYDIQADPDSKGLSVLEMMRKVPLLSVDGNNNILLKGSGNYKILINGKESALLAKSPSDVLNSMSATDIEKIEVITTPPAKYDAEGLSGIINIVTKRNVGQGYNVALNTRFNTLYGPGGNLNGTVKQGKIGVSVIVGGGSNGTVNSGFGNTENIFHPQSSIIQNGTSKQTGGQYYGSTEFSYEIDTLNLLTASVNLNGARQNQSSIQSAQTESINGLQQAFGLQSAGNGSFNGLDASINYQLGFKSSKDKLLTFSYKFSNAPNNQFTDNIFDGRFKYPQLLFPDYQQYNNAGNRDHTVQIDYASPLNAKVSIEAGAKAILRNNFSNYHINDRDSVTQQYITNNALTNDFNYHQDIYSLYNSYELKSDKWAGKAGLRLERTDINADFTSAGVTTAPSYDNLIPSVSVQRNFKSYSLNLGFTQRIQRPGIAQLNPFVDRSNPEFVNTGNPALHPELNNTFDLTYSNFAGAAINLDLSYAFSNNSIQTVSNLQVQTVNNKTDTVTYTTYQNLGTNKTLGANANISFTIGKKLSLTLNGQLNYVWLSGTFNGIMYNNSGVTGNAFCNIRYRMGKGYALSLNSYYFSGQVNLQGASNEYIFNQYLFSKDLFNRQMTIVLVANNPYARYYTSTSYINSAQFYQSTFSKSDYRSFAVRLNFKVDKLKKDIKRNEHGILNDDTKGVNKTPVVS